MLALQGMELLRRTPRSPSAPRRLSRVAEGVVVGDASSTEESMSPRRELAAGGSERASPLRRATSTETPSKETETESSPDHMSGSGDHASDGEEEEEEMTTKRSHNMAADLRRLSLDATSRKKSFISKVAEHSSLRAVGRQVSAGAVPLASNTGRVSSTAQRNELYHEQLRDTPLTQETIAQITTIHNIHVKFMRRRVAEDAMMVLASLGVLLMLATNEVTNAKRRMMWFDGECEWESCDARDDWANIVLKSLISLTTLMLIIVCCFRYYLENSILVMRGYYAEGCLVSLFRWPKLRVQLFLEVLICALHVPPGVDFSVEAPSTLRPRPAGPTRVVHINTYGVLMFIRLYMLARLMRNHNGMYSSGAHFMGALHGVNVNNAKYAMKYLFKSSPIAMVLVFTSIVTLTTTVVLTIVERPGASPTGVASFSDAAWLTLITMSTVGYGDLKPETELGRVTLVLGGVFGGALISMMLTGVFISYISMSVREDEVTVLFTRQLWERKIRKAAATMLQRAYRLKMGARKDTEFSRGRIALARLTEGQVVAQNSLRRLRRKEPVASTGTSTIDDIKASVNDLRDTLRTVLANQWVMAPATRRNSMGTEGERAKLKVTRRTAKSQRPSTAHDHEMKEMLGLSMFG